MIKGKRVVAAVLVVAVVLAGLGGCGKAAQIGGTESIVSSEPISSSETTPSVDYVPLDRFEDEKIINTELTRTYLSENPQTVSGKFIDAAKEWTKLFIKENYHLNVEDITFYNPANYSLDTEIGIKEYFKTGDCLAEIDSDLPLEGLKIWEDKYQLSLQIVAKRTKGEDYDSFTLVGFLTNRDNLIFDTYDLVEFLEGSPSFRDTGIITPEPLKTVTLDSLGYNSTEKNVDETSGLSVINLRSLTDGLEVDDFAFFPGDLLAILAVNPGAENEKVLMVFKAEELLPLYQQTFSNPASGFVRFEYVNGTAVLIQTPDDKKYKYFIPSENCVSEVPRPIARYQLSDTAFIIEEKFNLYLEQNGTRKLIFEGVYEDSVDLKYYVFTCRLSDTRFIYELYGYEWLEECGVYDIETGEKTIFQHENAELIELADYNEDKALLVPDDWVGSEYESYGPYLYEESTRKLVDLALPDIPLSDGNPFFYLFGNTLAVYAKNEPVSTFCLYDLSSREKIMNIAILSTTGYNKKPYYYTSGLCATENCIWFYSPYELPADYLLRIPIKR